MALPLTPLTVAWTFRAANPDDPPDDLDGWAALLSSRYGGIIDSALQQQNLPNDATHVNWAVAIAEVSNGIGARARLRNACEFVKAAGVGDMDFSPATLATVSQGMTARRSADTVPIADGRYSGGNHEVSVDVRVDCEGCAVISGDLYRLSSGQRHYVASFRTAPGLRVTPHGGEWPVAAQDEADRRVQGRLWLSSQTDPAGSIAGRLQLDGALEGLPSRRAIPFVAERASSSYRTLGLEIETEQGVDPIGSYTVNGRSVTVEDALMTAGFETYTTGVADMIPRRNDGWDMAQLHTLMTDLSQSSLLQRSWEIHLLVLSKSDRRGLLGVMFDSSDALPRQGAAVFAGEIRSIAGIDHDRKLIQTTVHELGHALNLAHRFERVVGRADSLSFMNYDWRYRGGSRSNEFWSRFAFTFDPDELEFLRHAPLPPLIPGGAPFHSVAYWADGNGGYSPYVPETPLTDWQLELRPPAGGSLLAFAEPVMLEIALTNHSGRTVTVPKFMLDPKAGFAEVVVRRVHAGAFAPGGAQSLAFVPVMQRCFEWDAADTVVLRDGDTMEDNMNLTFGSGGFAFAEPGTYEITALLVLFDAPNQRELIARSNTIRLRIALPRTDAEERDAMSFFTDEVGLYLALGGSPALGQARESLLAIADRRKNVVSDPLVAHITRAMAIDASRSYVRYSEGRFTTQAPRTTEAIRLLDRLQKDSMSAFDDSTKRSTAHLAQQCRKTMSGRPADHGPVAPKVTRERGAGAPRTPRTPRKRR